MGIGPTQYLKHVFLMVTVMLLVFRLGDVISLVISLIISLSFVLIIPIVRLSFQQAKCVDVIHLASSLLFILSMYHE